MNKIEQIKEILTERGLKLSCGESCTGGLISSTLTDVDGSSNFVEINFVTYSPYAKERFLNIILSNIKHARIIQTVTILRFNAIPPIIQLLLM